MGQGAQATLNKAIDSRYRSDIPRDPEFTRAAFLADSSVIIRGGRARSQVVQEDTGSRYSPAALQSWLQQEDDWASLRKAVRHRELCNRQDRNKALRLGDCTRLLLEREM